MKAMPYQLKQKIRRYQNTIMKANSIHLDIVEELERYGVPIEFVNGDADEYEAEDNKEAWTDALADASYGQGDIETNIEDIEKVFLHFVNKKN